MCSVTVISEKELLLENTGAFSPEKTFDCGQCFRFTVSEGSVTGIALGRRITIRKEGEGFILSGVTLAEFEEVWRRYLSLDTDYDAIHRTIVTALPEDDRRIMACAADVSQGIRILRQDRWEALCSFIVSQNNNIPRIKKIIETMCRSLGKPIGDGDYAFPTAEAVFAAGEEKIFSMGTGFRAKYIIDAARVVVEDPSFLDSVTACATYAEADVLLRQIKGVGPKVSACALLFGFGRTEAFPIDVWIRRVMDKYFPDGLDYTLFGDFAGIAQQYLFYYERYMGGE